jgi:hypothetical protein
MSWVQAKGEVPCVDGSIPSLGPRGNSNPKHNSPTGRINGGRSTLQEDGIGGKDRR